MAISSKGRRMSRRQRASLISRARPSFRGWSTAAEPIPSSRASLRLAGARGCDSPSPLSFHAQFRRGIVSFILTSLRPRKSLRKSGVGGASDRRSYSLIASADDDPEAAQRAPFGPHHFGTAAWQARASARTRRRPLYSLHQVT